MQQPINNGILESPLNCNGFGFTNVGGLLGTFEVPLSFSFPLSRTDDTNVVSIPAATSSVNGYLSSTDWSTFNNKVTSTETVSVDGQVVLFNGTTGKSIRKATGTGIAKVTSGVFNTVAAPTGDLIGHDDSQILYNKTLSLGTLVANNGLNFERPSGAGIISLLAQGGVSSLNIFMPSVAGTLITSGQVAATYEPLLGFTAVPTTRTVNGHALSGNVTVTPTDLGLVIGTNVEAWLGAPGFDDVILSSSSTGTRSWIPKTLSSTVVASNWLRSYDAATGLFTKSRPAIADLSDAGTLATWAGLTASNYATLASPTFTGTVGLPSGQALSGPNITDAHLSGGTQYNSTGGGDVILTAPSIVGEISVILPSIAGTLALVSQIPTSADYIPADWLDTDPTLSADDDSLVPSQKAVKAYVDANAGIVDGQQIFDVSHNLAADFGARTLVFDGSPILDWSSEDAVSMFGGSIIFNSDGTSSLVFTTTVLTDGTNSFGLSGVYFGIGTWKPSGISNDKISSNDEGTYFDNTGFHGVGSSIAGSFSGVGTATTSFVVTIGATMANSAYKVNVTPTAALSAAVFYISAKTTTTFTVTYLAGLTGTVTFDWAVSP